MVGWGQACVALFGWPVAIDRRPMGKYTGWPFRIEAHTRLFVIYQFIANLLPEGQTSHSFLSECVGVSNTLLTFADGGHPVRVH